MKEDVFLCVSSFHGISEYTVVNYLLLNNLVKIIINTDRPSTQEDSIYPFEKNIYNYLIVVSIHKSKHTVS